MYLHQARLTEAIKKLYMLGNKPYRGGKGTVETGNDVGGFVGGLVPQKKTKADFDRENTMANAIENQTKQATMQRAIQQGTMAKAISDAEDQSRWQELNSKAPDPNVWAWAQRQQELADAAVRAPVNGTFTKSGFSEHAAQTEKQANDLNMSKNLMGMGGSLRNYRNPEEL